MSNIRDYWKLSAQAQRKMKDAHLIRRRTMYSWRIKGHIVITYTNGTTTDVSSYDVDQEIIAADASTAIETVAKNHAAAYNKGGVTVTDISWSDPFPSAVITGIA